MKIYEHLEAYLGPISRGWAAPDNQWGIQVSLFENTPEPGVQTYATLGLSQYALAMGSRHVRQELICSVWAHYDPEEVASFLMTFAEEVARSRTALRRGEVVAGKPLLSSVGATGVYAAIPVLWPDGFEVLADTTPHTVIVWLLPVDHTEAHFVTTHGWSRFEDRLAESDLDFWNLSRPSVV
jgi:hypothetical protein